MWQVFSAVLVYLPQKYFDMDFIRKEIEDWKIKYFNTTQFLSGKIELHL